MQSNSVHLGSFASIHHTLTSSGAPPLFYTPDCQEPFLTVCSSTLICLTLGEPSPVWLASWMLSENYSQLVSLETQRWAMAAHRELDLILSFIIHSSNKQYSRILSVLDIVQVG